MKLKIFYIMSILFVIMITGVVNIRYTAGVHTMVDASADTFLLCCDGPAEVVCQ